MFALPKAKIAAETGEVEGEEEKRKKKKRL